MSTNKLEAQWREIFEKYHVLAELESRGYFDISAEQIHALNMEPRLLTKIDHANQVPSVFRSHEVNIITRGRKLWRLGKFEVFEQLPDWVAPGDDVKNVSAPETLWSLDPNNITSESAAINAAAASGILADFLGAEPTLTISGRMSTPTFSFNIRKKRGGFESVEVSKAQIEIDAGFETADSITLFEAKNRIATDFCTRQLYYPLRAWKDKVVAKPIRTVFMTYANQVFDLAEFEFTDLQNYSSAELTRRSRYAIGIERPSVQEVDLLASRVGYFDKPKDGNRFIPFPQADSVERILDLVTYLSQSPRTQEDIRTNYDFTARQADYYPNAARYLGLAAKKPVRDGQDLWSVTPEAVVGIGLPYREKLLWVASLMLRIPPVQSTYVAWRRSGAIPSLEWIESELGRSPLAVQDNGEKLGPSTIHRRARTVRSWATWVTQIVAP